MTPKAFAPTMSYQALDFWATSNLARLMECAGGNYLVGAGFMEKSMKMDILQVHIFFIKNGEEQ
jgi:hypothetical protein